MDGQARFIVARGLALILSLWGAALATGQAEAVTSLELADLDGSNGFVINGIAAGDGAGHVSDAGDINDDGIDDFIIGAAGADPNGLSDAGQTYVIFGTEAGFPATLGEVPGFSDAHIERALAAAKNPQLKMKLENMPVPLTAEMVDEYMGPVLEAAKTGELDGIKNVE